MRSNSSQSETNFLNHIENVPDLFSVERKVDIDLDFESGICTQQTSGGHIENVPDMSSVEHKVDINLYACNISHQDVLFDFGQDIEVYDAILRLFNRVCTYNLNFVVGRLKIYGTRLVFEKEMNLKLLIEDRGNLQDLEFCD